MGLVPHSAQEQMLARYEQIQDCLPLFEKKSWERAAPDLRKIGIKIVPERSARDRDRFSAGCPPAAKEERCCLSGTPHGRFFKRLCKHSLHAVFLPGMKGATQP